MNGKNDSPLLFLCLQIVVLGLILSTLFLFFFPEDLTVLWICSTALGVFYGPLIPSCYAWANRYIEVTAVVQMISHIGGALLDIGFLTAYGYSYQHYGPYSIWSYQLVFGAVICVSSWLMQLFGTLHGDRYDNTQK